MSRAHLIIRPLSRAHLPELRALIRKVFNEYHARYATLGLRWCDVIVAEADGRLVGFVEYYTATILDADCLIIYYVGVDPRARRRGIGRELVLAAERSARGVDVALASTTRENLAARRLFASLGYRELELWEAPLDEDLRWELVYWVDAYEDDLLMYKPMSGRRGALVEALERAAHGKT